MLMAGEKYVTRMLACGTVLNWLHLLVRENAFNPGFLPNPEPPASAVFLPDSPESLRAGIISLSFLIFDKR